MSLDQTAGRGMAVVAAALVLGVVTSAHAATTTESCLAMKLRELGSLRKCQATENAKALQGRPADPVKCQTRFDDRLAAINTRAMEATIPCRYRLNGDGTATDYDTGLQWERKTDDGSVHDKDNSYSWNTADPNTPPNGTAFTEFLGTLNNGTRVGGAEVTSGCFAGHCDWRLPAIEELTGIVDMTAPGCGSGGPCIDQTVFGPAGYDLYWSATTQSETPRVAAHLYLYSGQVGVASKGYELRVRAVRSAL